MDNVIHRLTPQQALAVLMRLSNKGGAIGEAVLAEARYVLSAIELDQIADGVFFVLDTIDVQDCWDRATMDAFIEERCPKWAARLSRSAGRKP